MRIIGLCGRSGSGKGVFAKIARTNGIRVIDCDAVYKDMVSRPSPCLSEIAEAFGESVIKDSALNRRALAPIVFSDTEKLKLLNKITHKYILAEINSILSDCAPDETVILDAPTLFESGIDSMCDMIIGIIAPDEACIARIVVRDNISESDAASRLSNQLSREFIIENCDILLYNDTTLDDFERSSLEAVKSFGEGSL